MYIDRNARKKVFSWTTADAQQKVHALLRDVLNVRILRLSRTLDTIALSQRAKTHPLAYWSGIHWVFVSHEPDVFDTVDWVQGHGSVYRVNGSRYVFRVFYPLESIIDAWRLVLFLQTCGLRVTVLSNTSNAWCVECYDATTLVAQSGWHITVMHAICVATLRAVGRRVVC